MCWPIRSTRSHRLLDQVFDVVSGACGFCARAFEAEEHIHEAKVPLLEEYNDHPSIRRLVVSGYQVITSEARLLCGLLGDEECVAEDAVGQGGSGGAEHRSGA